MGYSAAGGSDTVEDLAVVKKPGGDSALPGL